MKKITVGKDEGIAEIIERIIEAEDEEVTLVIPKGASILGSAANFHLLKREADAAQKTVAVESVDDTALAYAKDSELEGNHPLWRGVRGGGGMSDIIPTGAGGNEAEELIDEKPTPKKRKQKSQPVKLVVREQEVESTETQETFGAEGLEEFEEKEAHFFNRKSAPEVDGDDDEGEDRSGGARRRWRSRKALMWWAGAAVAIIALIWIVTSVFGHVAIAINFVKSPWNFSGNFVADKSVSVVNAANGTVPAQIFSSEKNATQLFPASGKATVSIKAQGILTVVNAYSSASQDLVATTRFVTPDGKLFRLAASLTVPGAKVTNGEIVPSSVDATVIADQPGPDYNIGPVAKLSIPGFKGTPKYNAFYGELKKGTSGGFTGTRAVPTAADISSARTKMTTILQSALSNDIAASYPNNFKILDGATNVAVSKLTVNTSTDQNGNFSVFGEATLQAIGFDESSFKDALLALAQKDAPDSVWSGLDVSYRNVRADFGGGKVSFGASVSGTLMRAFSREDFIAAIGGKTVSEARAAIARVPGLANGKISVWPMWLWHIPTSPGKIEITTD